MTRGHHQSLKGLDGWSGTHFSPAGLADPHLRTPCPRLAPKSLSFEYVPKMAPESWPQAARPSQPHLVVPKRLLCGITFFCHLLLCLFWPLHFFFFFESHLCYNANTCFYSTNTFFWFLEYTSWQCLGIYVYKISTLNIFYVRTLFLGGVTAKFWNNFRISKKLHESYKEFLHSLYPDSPVVNISSLASSFRLCVDTDFLGFLSEPFERKL